MMPSRALEEDGIWCQTLSLDISTGNTAAGATKNFLGANTAAIDSERLAVYGWNGIKLHNPYNLIQTGAGFWVAPGQGFWVAAASTTPAYSA